MHRTDNVEYPLGSSDLTSLDLYLWGSSRMTCIDKNQQELTNYVKNPRNTIALSYSQEMSRQVNKFVTRYGLTRGEYIF